MRLRITLIGAHARFNSVDAQAALFNGHFMKEPPTPLPDLDGMMDLVARFEAACADDPALESAELDEVIRLVPGKRAVVSGTWQSRPAVFRFILSLNSGVAAREWAELTRVWPHMQGEDLRIAEPFYHAKAHQFNVVEYAPGTPLMELIWQSDASDRAKWLAPAARWLRAYTAPSEEVGAPTAKAWFDRATLFADTQTHRKLIRRERLVLKQLRRLLPLLDQPWRSAISHGDYHPNNLLASDNRLIGIDCGGSKPSPIYKDMARFLMHMGRRGLIPSGQARFGVDAQGIEAFVTAFALSDHERTLVLPFMLGCEALLRVEHPGMKRGRIRRAAAMTEQLAEDLALI